MTIIIFAGGAGTRLWPLSRRNSPKQFGKFRDNTSTLQMAVERVKSFGYDNIYISTNVQYADLVREQIPELPTSHILFEPVKRDLAAAVGLSLFRLKERGVSGTVAVIWSDHFMDAPDRFVTALLDGERLVQAKKDRLVFIGETPRFANHNLGWIHVGQTVGLNQHRFLGWKYRPDLAACQVMFSSGEWLWNTGYFLFDIDTVLDLYRRHQEHLYNALRAMGDDDKKITHEYGTLPAMSFDSAIVEHVDPDQAIVLKVDLGWSDPGTLYALKEALEPMTDNNIERGNVLLHSSKDCFVYNEESEKIVTTVGLTGMVIVNTKDALLVCHKDNIPEVKLLLQKLEDQGLERHL